MSARRRLLLGGSLVALATAVVVSLLTLGGGDKYEKTGSAAGEQLLREQQLSEQRARIRELERKKARLEHARKRRKSASAAPSSAGASSSQSKSFAALAGSLSGSVGVAFGRPGIGQRATLLGDWSSGPAWSTIKAPISVATVRSDGGSPSSGDAALMRRAITASDNEAAKALWAGLGSPAAAGRKTEAVLADAGDSTTSVQTQQVRSQFTSFGQTDWSLAAQQTFAAALPCLNGGRSVLDLMAQVIGGQRWGLGQAGSNQRFKGGWGPDTGDHYLVRQFGLIDLPSGGTLAVAIAAKPADGSFETGKAQLGELAAWVAEHATGAGAPKC